MAGQCSHGLNKNQLLWQYFFLIHTDSPYKQEQQKMMIPTAHYLIVFQNSIVPLAALKQLFLQKVHRFGKKESVLSSIK